MNQPTPVAEARRTEVQQFGKQLDGMLGQFAAVLPPHISAKQFARVTLTAIQNNRDLLECERVSLWNACMRAAQDGLLPDGRHGAMVVFKDSRRGVKTAQWMPMIAGIRQKIRNSGEVATLDVEVVREKDHWEYERGDNPRIVHRPAPGERGRVIAAYSIAVLKSGERSREWMWVEDIEDIRKRSRAATSGPWVTDYAEMCKKTVARRHSKILPMSTDVFGVLNRDDEFDRTPHAGAPSQPEHRALTDALSLLQQKPEEPGDVRPPFDPETGELEQEAVEAQTEQAATPEQIDAFNRAADAKITENETAAERLAHIERLNNAATAGNLDRIYARLPTRWQEELKPEYEQLKAGAR